MISFTGTAPQPAPARSTTPPSPASGYPARSATSRPAGPTPPARRRPARPPGPQAAPPRARTHPGRTPAAPPAPRRSPAALQPPVTQRHLKAEIALCVGGVVSPVLANLFLHLAFDAWMGREFPDCPFE